MQEASERRAAEQERRQEQKKPPSTTSAAALGIGCGAKVLCWSSYGVCCLLSLETEARVATSTYLKYTPVYTPVCVKIHRKFTIQNAAPNNFSALPQSRSTLERNRPSDPTDDVTQGA